MNAFNLPKPFLLVVQKGCRKLSDLGSQLRLLVYGVLQRMREDRATRVASSLAFTTLLALVPLLTVTFSILSLFPVFEKWRSIVEKFLYANFVPATGDVVTNYLHELANHTDSLTAISAGVLILSTLLLFSTIENTFNDIWRVKNGRRLAQRLLVYWAMITLGPVLMVASLSVTSYLVSLPMLSGMPVPENLGTRLLKLLPLLFEATAFLLMYLIIPNQPVIFRHALAGTAASTILFEISKYVFAIYMTNVYAYQIIYGALWVIPVFFVWIFISWFVVLIGACITAEMPAISGNVDLTEET